MSLQFAGVPQDNDIAVRFNEKVHQILKFMDERLGDVPYLAGDELTAADIMVLFSLTGMREVRMSYSSKLRSFELTTPSSSAQST
jgi:glutathione S-transferase